CSNRHRFSKTSWRARRATRSRAHPVTDLALRLAQGEVLREFSMSLDTQIETLRSELSVAIAAADSEAALDAVRVAALGKKGSVSALLATLGSMAPEERKSAGPAINGLKNDIASLIEARSAELKAAALEARLKAETVDVTLPLKPAP